MWFEPGEADMNSSEVAPRLSTAGHSVPMHLARDSRSSRAHTQRVCARVPPFRALVPLAGALLDMSLPLYYRVAAFEQPVDYPSTALHLTTYMQDVIFHKEDDPDSVPWCIVIP